MSLSSWYALTVKPRHEQTASQHLGAKGLERFVPTYRTSRRWSDRRKEVELCLFPGYVFCRFDAAHRVPVLQSAGVAGIVL